MTDAETVTTEEKSYSQGQLVRRRFFRHRGAIVAMVVLAVVIIVAFTSLGIGPIPGWWDKDPVSQYEKIGTGAPTWEHPFGQDTIGKDYFALVMLGTQKSVIIALGVGLISTVIGTVVGAFAGYYRGWVEAALMRLTDLLIVIPLLVLAAVLGKIASPWGIWGLTLMLGIVTWTGLARLVRGEVLSLRERDFVVAATAVGTGAQRIIFKHVLPNAVGTIIVSATLAISAAILLETSLSFLGFGVQAPDTSLGLLISQYQTAFTTRPWLFWWPGLMILAIALSVNFIGDGLRDAFDPRQNRTKA
ncbi:peptide/nickel transport system permease protein [Isoptericola sp. CG 20/1183]|uniref:Peptide/nickel transport system permease protein n=1 Tax=Isoptericola halotolerans TaxID=300560 RepID=A0ABX5EF85_9MICO|nr:MULTISPECIES: ABC transporter permease [Isoptericola]PRZ07770.1 peptide/nickel transport system permease protein [Isoptericola halotolerans]PRZ07871.1 peptide/nickel transport system permease protein [Isoptericola sp. CG 20/1183]